MSLAGLIFAGYVGLNGLGSFADKFQGEPCDDYLNAINSAEAPAYTVLWNSSFGNNRNCLKKFLNINADRPHAVVVYIDNGASRKARQLEPGDFWYGYSVNEFNQLIETRNQNVLQSFADSLDDIRSFFSRNASSFCQVVIIPGLEDIYSDKAWEVLGPFVKERTPYLLVRNPGSGGRYKDPAYFIEKHGAQASCSGWNQIANLDGSSLSKSRARKWLKKNRECFIEVGYDARCQGRTGTDGFVKGRANRDFDCNSFWGELIGEL